VRTWEETKIEAQCHLLFPIRLQIGLISMVDVRCSMRRRLASKVGGNLVSNT